MGYAPHTNTEVAHQLHFKVENPLPIIFGSFVEKEFGHTFEYSERRWPDDEFYPELCHVVYVGDGQTRLAKVLKKVAWVLTGDGELQRWHIKQHRHYSTDWIRE